MSWRHCWIHQILVGANVGALVGSGIALILTTFAHKNQKCNLETSILTQDKDFLLDQHLCTRHVHEN